MELSIKQNDAFRHVVNVTGLSEVEVTKTILEGLEAIDFLIYPETEITKSIQEIINEYNEFIIGELVHATFPKFVDNPEFEEIFGNIRFWGGGTEIPCSNCGCEMTSELDFEFGYKYENFTCSNSECENTINNSPDWDALIGMN